jgi:hypothetical protein
MFKDENKPQELHNPRNEEQMPKDVRGILHERNVCGSISESRAKHSAYILGTIVAEIY